MVERLKAAIEKARERRNVLAGDEIVPSAVPGLPSTAAHAAWEALPELTLSPDALARRRVVNYERDPRNSQCFDMLRTRLLKVCAENGWRRIGVTSPTKGCGKTMLSANLAFSFGRHATAHTIVMDLDLRAPGLAPTLGVKAETAMEDFLKGAVGHEAILSRVNERLAFGLNARAMPDASELLQTASAEAALSKMIAALAPTIVLYDLPPVLAGDETFGFLDKLDAFVLVAAAGETRAEQIEECEQIIAGAAPLIGVVLNKAAEETLDGYEYAYGAT